MSAAVQKPGIVIRTEEMEHEAPYYGTCSTAAGTAAKTVTVDGAFALETGAKVCVKFSNTDSSASPTLNVNGTGAKAIRLRGAAVDSGVLCAGGANEFVYDGTAWELVGCDDRTWFGSAKTVSTVSPSGGADGDFWFLYI